MSHQMTQLGGRAFNHEANGDAEREYDRLRDLARQEHGKASSFGSKSHNAYERGDGGAAHEFSEEAKKHRQMADQYNKQASDYIFRENNAVGRVDGDTIDLHGQFVEEAEEILEARIKYAKQHGQTHLHVIVGKGNHSPGHIQKIKPRVEQVCQELHLQFATEENAGRIYVNLTGGPAIMPAHLTSGGGHGQQHHGGQQHGQNGPHYNQNQGQYQQGGYQQGGYQQGGYPNQPQQQQQQYAQQQGYGGQHGGGQQNDQNAQIEAAVKKYLPRLLRKFCPSCTVM